MIKAREGSGRSPDVALYLREGMCVFLEEGSPPTQTRIPAWATIEPLEYEHHAVQQLLLDPPVDVWPGFLCGLGTSVAAYCFAVPAVSGGVPVGEIHC